MAGSNSPWVARADERLQYRYLRASGYCSERETRAFLVYGPGMALRPTATPPRGCSAAPAAARRPATRPARRSTAGRPAPGRGASPLRRGRLRSRAAVQPQTYEKRLRGVRLRLWRATTQLARTFNKLEPSTSNHHPQTINLQPFSIKVPAAPLPLGMCLAVGSRQQSQQQSQ